MAEVSREQVKDFIKNMTLLDAAALVKELEAELGVSAAAPVAVAGPGAGAAAAVAEEKTEFNVILAETGEKKIQVIKEGVSKAEAETVKKKLEEQGAKVEIK
jgi:large subunit ribosomal protein L7/L12